MRIVRPEWPRDLSMKSWGKGHNLALLFISAPARTSKLPPAGNGNLFMLRLKWHF